MPAERVGQGVGLVEGQALLDQQVRAAVVLADERPLQRGGRERLAHPHDELVDQGIADAVLRRQPLDRGDRRRDRIGDRRGEQVLRLASGPEHGAGRIGRGGLDDAAAVAEVPADAPQPVVAEDAVVVALPVVRRVGVAAPPVRVAQRRAVGPAEESLDIGVVHADPDALAEGLVEQIVLRGRLDRGQVPAGEHSGVLDRLPLVGLVGQPELAAVDDGTAIGDAGVVQPVGGDGRGEPAAVRIVGQRAGERDAVLIDNLDRRIERTPFRLGDEQVDLLPGVEPAEVVEVLVDLPEAVDRPAHAADPRGVADRTAGADRIGDYAPVESVGCVDAAVAGAAVAVALAVGPADDVDPHAVRAAVAAEAVLDLQRVGAVGLGDPADEVRVAGVVVSRRADEAAVGVAQDDVRLELRAAVRAGLDEHRDAVAGEQVDREDVVVARVRQLAGRLGPEQLGHVGRSGRRERVGLGGGAVGLGLDDGGQHDARFERLALGRGAATQRAAIDRTPWLRAEQSEPRHVDLLEQPGQRQAGQPPGRRRFRDRGAETQQRHAPHGAQGSGVRHDQGEAKNELRCREASASCKAAGTIPTEPQPAASRRLRGPLAASDPFAANPSARGTPLFRPSDGDRADPADGCDSWCQHIGARRPGGGEAHPEGF